MVYEIEGRRFHTLEEFFDEISAVLIPGAEWGRNLDAFNDFMLVNDSARAVRTIFLNESSEAQTRLRRVIIECVSTTNREVVGALIIELGLEGGLPWYFPIPGTADLANGLADGLHHRPRTPTENELRVLVDWAVGGLTSFGRTPARRVQPTGRPRKRHRAILR